MKKLIILALLLVAVWKLTHPTGAVVLGPGITAAEPPLQVDRTPTLISQADGYNITALADFQITAKVLGREDYSLGREADLSPVDLALGWGRMSDEAVLENIDISQSGRFYYWRVESFPIPRREIETHSANMHLIPADPGVLDTIKDIRPGDVVALSGSLVHVKSEQDGWHWRSSLTRNDTGGGACELIWVEDISIVTP